MTAPTALTSTQVDAYLERIHIAAHPEPSEDWLERLHLAHLLQVPFENLDLHANRPITLEVPALFDKVVHRRRGGYCYELNGLFASLLSTLGFEVSLVASQVWMPDGQLSAPFDHLALIVDIGDVSWLVDVGYGDAFLTPRPLGSNWAEPGRRLRSLSTPDGWQLEKDAGDGWAPMYLLDLTPRALSDFLPRSRWHETDPRSPFQNGAFTSRATARGRVTITEDRLIVTRGDQRTVSPLLDAAAHDQALIEHFAPPVAEAFGNIMRTHALPGTSAPTRATTGGSVAGRQGLEP